MATAIRSYEDLEVWKRGSLAELGTCLIIARRLGYLREESFASEMRETAELAAMLRGLATSLERKTEGLPLTLGLVLGGVAVLLLL